MGKPTNTKNNGCAVTTSNCVVWQGPDLCCIDLCTGDSISEVINELAKKICKIFEILDPTLYDISDLTNGDCPPANFVEMLQALITTVIDLKSESGSSSSSSASSSCPTCEIAVASCFQEGGTIMNFDDYVTAMGIKICNQQVQINTLNSSYAQLVIQMNNIQAQLNLLQQGG